MRVNQQLPMGSCRGQNKKEQILELYKLEEVFHGVALNDEITGCCEDTPLAEYHRFDFQMREPDTQTALRKGGVMYVGSHCAREFRKLMMERGEGHDFPSLFNPLMTYSSSEGGYKSPLREGGTPRDSRPMITVEGENALNLMMSLFPRTAENQGAILNIYNEIRESPDAPLLPRQVKGINTAIGRYIKRAKNADSLVEVAQQVASTRGEAIRSFRFPELSQALERYKTHGGYDRDNALVLSCD
ncbi:MAG: hypothetical protein ACRBCK_07220 [Alphaproteobacteria bacterium]